jgi:purine-nucleoside phosphorylase
MAGRLGAAVVGMSTVMEVIAARQLGLPVVCFGFISNMAAGVTAEPVDNVDVLRQASLAQESYRRLVLGLLPHLP